MADSKILIIFFILFSTLDVANCVFHPIHKRVEALNNKSKIMYGEVDKIKQEDNVYFETQLLYPRGDKTKLSSLSALWREYYDCLAERLESVTSLGQVPSLIVVVYDGAVARLPCNMCTPPGEQDRLKWIYAQSTVNLPFTEVIERERTEIKDGNLTIYNVQADDAGAYQCVMEDSAGGMLVLEVVDEEEPHTVVKPPTSKGPLATPAETMQGITLFNLWSPWSSCSVCDKVGRRHRHGMCFVKLDEQLVTGLSNKTHGLNILNEFPHIDDNVITLFEGFPDGIPCRSKYLPPLIKQLDAVQQRTNEIMIGMCKVPCEPLPAITQAAFATLGENVSAGILLYSISQVPRKQPPLPARNTIFADFGQRITVRCPGTTLRDVPVQWRIGTKRVLAREIDKESGGRVHLNSRDHLIINTVLYLDANLYSCWQVDELCGSVKLVVWSGKARWSQHVTLATALAGLVLIHVVLQRSIRGVKQSRNAGQYMYYL